MSTLNSKFREHPALKRRCPQCNSTDVIFVPGSPTYFYCKEEDCPSKKSSFSTKELGKMAKKKHQ